MMNIVTSSLVLLSTKFNLMNRFKFFIFLFISLFYLISGSAVLAQDSLFIKKLYISPESDTLRYRILYPGNYDKTREYPLILFLHGSGERGRDNQSQLEHGSDQFVAKENRENFPAIVVFPQCPADSWWANLDRKVLADGGREFNFPDRPPPTKPLELTMRLLDELATYEKIDTSRLYVMGLSMGGFGTYELLSRKPKTFAAAVPICGGANLSMSIDYADNTAVWIFHGDEDSVVPVEFSRKIYGLLKERDAKVKYTEYEGVDHNSWDPAFAEPELLPWLFSHKLD